MVCVTVFIVRVVFIGVVHSLVSCYDVFLFSVFGLDFAYQFHCLLYFLFDYFWDLSLHLYSMPASVFCAIL